MRVVVYPLTGGRRGAVPAGPEAHVPDVSAEPRVHGRGRGRTGARHRGQHRDFLGGQRRPAEATAVPGCRQRRVLHEHQSAGARRSWRVSRQVRALAPADHSHPGRHRVSHQRRQLHGGRVPRTVASRTGERQTTSSSLAPLCFVAVPSHRRRICRAALVSRSSVMACGSGGSAAIPTSSARRFC